LNTFNFDGNYFSKSYEVLNDRDREDLISQAELYISTHRKIEELHPPIMAEKFFNRSLLELDCWKNLFVKSVSSANNYAKKYLNLKVKFESCWINKVGSYDNEDIKNTLYFDEDLQSYTDNHYHSHHEGQLISCIYYLQNPDKKYGTLVRTKNGSIALDGTENSLTIFDPRLHHTAITPDSKITSKYPRYAILITFIKSQ
jgi:hypothetical protein